MSRDVGCVAGYCADEVGGVFSDGIGCGVMLEVARVLVDRNADIDGTIIFSGSSSLPGWSSSC